jgi:tripartite-type tricarboxylate transporter receptor subunit TctC
MEKKFFLRVGFFLLMSGLTLPGFSQSWPSKSIKIIAPVPPGGGVDILSRAIAQKLSVTFSIPVVVENKAGASAVVGTDFVAKSPPDGYTLLMGYSVLATNKYLVKSLPYDLEKDLTPVAYVGYIPLMLVTPPSFPPKTVTELITLLKANPDKYSYASGGAGAGAHLSAEMFKHITGTKLVHVPYKGNAPALADVLGGHLPIMFDTITTSLPHVRSGKLKALATTGPKRSPLAPELPTITDPEMVKQMAAMGVSFVGGSIGQADQFLSSEITNWGGIIKAADIKAE